MKKLLLIFALLISLSSYAQTFNDYNNPQSLFAVNIVPEWAVKEVSNVIESVAIFPAPIWDENTAYGRCMNNAARECAASAYCGLRFSLFSAAYIAGWSVMCLTQNQATITPIKTL